MRGRFDLYLWFIFTCLLARKCKGDYPVNNNYYQPMGYQNTASYPIYNNQPRYGFIGTLFGVSNPPQTYYIGGGPGNSYCRVAQIVGFAGRTARYYCDCPPNPPNYQLNFCLPINFG